MTVKTNRVIVIGTSAGGLEALESLIAKLPVDIPAAIFIVQHMAPENTGQALLQLLKNATSLPCKMAENDDIFQTGNIYIAPPDNHLLVKKKNLLVTKGARENRYRPGIDPLFRSAAVTHHSSVIGVLLTGMLDDGTAGLIAIEKCGGVTVVQDPQDAAYPQMPQSAIANVNVDHVVPVGEMGLLLGKLARENPGKSRPVPKEIKIEAEIAERVLSDVRQVNYLGKQVPYNCPNCGGVLWQMEGAAPPRYRCHTGHSFSVPALLVSQTEKIEETLWVCLRMLEERKNLLNGMPGPKHTSVVDRIKEAQMHIESIREILVSPES